MIENDRNKEAKLTNDRDMSMKWRIKLEEDNKAQKGLGKLFEQNTFIWKKTKGRELRLGTWNIKEIFEEGLATTLDVEVKKYEMKILTIQETHIKETKII